MATIKSYSDLQQSKKLAEILPLESADMCYLREDGKAKTMSPSEISEILNVSKPQVIPCWSLSALLSVLPRYINFEGHIVYLNIYLTKNLGWVIEYSNNKEDFVKFSFNSEHLIDACYKMIVKLNELKKL